MNKYEKSTIDSEQLINNKVMVTGHKRAGTNMDFRESDTLDKDMVKQSKKLPTDPFYSHDMVKLADEA